jgi:lipopolysaccharide export system protein LptC
MKREMGALGVLKRLIQPKPKASLGSRAPAFASNLVSDRNDAFAIALRNSRRVRFLRRLIPLSCLAVFLGPIAWGIISPFASTAPEVKMGGVSVSGSKVIMESPKLSGFKRDQKSYEVTAAQAIQDIKVPSVVELNKLVARMEQEKNSFARLSSDWGRMDQTADRLDLKGNVRVKTDSGYEVDLQSAVVNMKSGDVTSTEPVKVRSKSATISADSVDVKDNGKHVVFQGRVHSVLTPPDEASEQKK